MDNNLAVKDNIYLLFRDLLLIEIGLMVSSLGTAFFYVGGNGSAPMATFCDGIHKVLSISYGAANVIINLLLLLVLFVLKRQYIHIGTLLCVFTIGPWVNLFTSLLSVLGINDIVLPGLFLSIGGTILMGLGLGLYVAVDRGFGALEGLVKFFCYQTGISVSKAKILQDTLLVVGGIILKATWGAGTIIAVTLTGFIMQRSMSFFGCILKPNSGNLTPKQGIKR